MNRNAELGATRLRTLIILLILAAAGFVVSRVFPPYFANSQLADKMYEEARFAEARERTGEQLRDIIYNEAQLREIPIRREDIQVERGSMGTRISADYSVIVDLNFYQLPLHFHPTSVR